jgi:hypothetical protein
VLCFALIAACPGFAADVVIELKNGSGVERETKVQLEKLLKLTI